MGRIADIELPTGCNRIHVDWDDEKMIITYRSKLNDKEFFCEETGEMEMIPSAGDFCIFWDNGRRYNAICANYEQAVFISGTNKTYHRSSGGRQYDKAIKFRNYQQYIAVKGVIDDTI